MCFEFDMVDCALLAKLASDLTVRTLLYTAQKTNWYTKKYNKIFTLTISLKKHGFLTKHENTSCHENKVAPFFSSMTCIWLWRRASDNN